MKKFLEKKLVKFLLLPLILIFIVIQFIPVDRTNPPVTYKPVWDSQQTEDFARRACFDCHSNETTWPWYSYVAPASLLVGNHVKDGRKHLNFSEPDPGDAEEMVEEIQAGNMPIAGYVMLHSNAKLTDAEKLEFIKGLKATFGEGETAGKENEGEDHK